MVIHHTVSLFTIRAKYLLGALGISLFSISLQAEEVNVVLIGGQSNATGQGYVRNIPDSFKTNEHVTLYYSKYLKGPRNAEQCVPLSPASESPDRFGVELSLGTSLQAQFPNKRWALIKHALSGSNLYSQWNPGKSATDTQGPEYVKFIQTVRQGLQALKQRGDTPVIKAMVWQQGEADARDIAGMGVSKAYGTNLKHLIERLREDLQTPDMWFVYGSVLPVPDQKRFPGRETVLQCQKDVAASGKTPLSTSKAIHVPAGDLQLRSTDYRTPHPGDTIHLGTYGILTLGERFANALKKEWEKQP